ncbi:hypothetical protein [Burkholderia stabilis]|uniref:T6SS effector phospholipase Tle3 domain-containing protein n=1 Tax=Burkholderia stabilis TaxID=95485 RepID=UPI001F47B2F2|nr:hypothetical protein [Burkholderia stabilis]
MMDQSNQPDDADTPKPYRHDTATRIVPMQRDHLGQPYWESYHTPSSFQVRAECRIPPHMPSVIIFVHGVNSTGEWYDAAEQALCDGLNDRLKRPEGAKLKANNYIAVDPDTKKPIPRQLDPDATGNSPVIRFYWGYSAAPAPSAIGASRCATRAASMRGRPCARMKKVRGIGGAVLSRTAPTTCRNCGAPRDSSVTCSGSIWSR